MSEMKARPFNRRALTVMVIAVSGIGLPLSGLILHLLPAGPMGLARHAWMAAHWSLGIIFICFSLWHAFNNRRVLLHYLRDTARRASGISRELSWALVLVGGIVLIAMAHAFHAG